jgi:hypothetical protein
MLLLSINPGLRLRPVPGGFLIREKSPRKLCRRSGVPLFAEMGQKPVPVLTADVLQAFLTHQEFLAPTTYNRRLAASHWR